MNFIPAKESRFLIWFFDLYTRWLLRRRFKNIFIKQVYKPGADTKTVYFINHNLWWDGLLPLYLSRNVFHQTARAFMEDKQMRKHRFFSKIGAFSINLSDPRSTLRSLRFAIDSLNKPNSSLYIYPEGEITPVSASKPEFKKGMAWLYQNTDIEIDFVPIAFYSHSFRDSKPELYINIGKRSEIDRSLAKDELTSRFEEDVHQLLIETRDVAGFSDEGFRKI
ncbi:MAG: lysophospholipid acyltransferase family protein [Balneola sp.]